MTPEYAAFLARKAPRSVASGLAKAPDMPGHLKPFQANATAFALCQGRAGLYLDTGLGKTRCQLEFLRHAAEATNGRALLLTPLAVAKQIEREGAALGYDCRVIREQAHAKDGINICNYDRLDKLDADAFGAVSLDESSILKNFTGATSRALIAAFAGHRFKLSATATPAPNDHMELGQQAEFLTIMSSNEMLSRFFINDTSKASQEWRLKGHAVDQFWDWMASWARMATLPSDLGDSDEGYILQPLEVIRHKTGAIDMKAKDGFFAPDISATNLHDVKRQTIKARAEIAAHICDAEQAEPFVLWVDTDYEADALKAVIPDALEVRGSMPIEQKEKIIEEFSTGHAHILITKPSVTGHGLNWQHCARTVFVGRSFSYEAWYQAVRRFWRFGQKRPVKVHIVVAEGEDQIGRVIDRKADDHADMKQAMRAAMRRATGRASAIKVPYNPTYQGRLPTWLTSCAV